MMKILHSTCKQSECPVCMTVGDENPLQNERQRSVAKGTERDDPREGNKTEEGPNWTRYLV